MVKYDIFLSYKHTDSNGEITSDSAIAEQLYHALQQQGYSVFYSENSIFEVGISDYKKAIDAALDSAYILVVIASDIEYLLTGWVEYEFETFFEDILSGRKNGTIVSYTDNIPQNKLPRTLSRFQNYPRSKCSLEKLIDFLNHSIKSFQGDHPYTHKQTGIDLSLIQNAQKAYQAPKSLNGDTPHKSVYSSDYSNEFLRLAIQAKNSAPSDKTALDYLWAQNPWPQEEELYVLDVGSAYGYVSADRFCPIDQVKSVLCLDYNPRVIERARIQHADNPKMIFEELDLESDDMPQKLSELMIKHAIPCFHIVYSALTLHHLKNPNRVLRNLRRMMNEKGYIILRGSDDGSKLCYPKSELMDSIIRKTLEVKGVSDRRNGRKIYSQLKNSGFRDIKMFSCMKDLSGIPYDDIGLLYQESFSYRINYFKIAMDSNPGSLKAKEDYQWMKNALEELENQFYQSDFWYCEYDYVGIGHI